MHYTAEQIEAFQRTVWEYYRAHGRHNLPWRLPDDDGAFDLYTIIVSEIMLQQTQVQRVLPKFATFTAQFPTFEALAEAPLAEVLKAWSGLGYNRRAKFLWQAAQAVVGQGGDVARTTAELSKLPGIGINTAGAVLAYAYNAPVVFIETNVRTVFVYHFFADRADKVHDRDIADLVAATLPENSREWYWALMDYGTFLKQTVGNLSRNSVHYAKQSAFNGSKRQIRGHVLRLLAAAPQTDEMLKQTIADERLAAVLDDLMREELIDYAAGFYTLHGA